MERRVVRRVRVDEQQRGADEGVRQKSIARLEGGAQLEQALEEGLQQAQPPLHVPQPRPPSGSVSTAARAQPSAQPAAR